MTLSTRLLLFAIISGLISSGLLPSVKEAAADDITIGIRKDARPFAELQRGADPTALGSYSGFAAKLCQDVIRSVAAKRGHRAIVKPVTVSERFSGLTGDNRELDLACGPISITAKRLDKYVFSFPFFLSGISYALGSTNFGELKRKRKLGVLWNTTVLSELGEVELTKHIGFIATETLKDLALLSKLSGPSDPQKADILSQMQHVVPVTSYNEGYELLCKGDVDYLFGDVDILSAYSETYRNGKNCDSTVSRVTLTREMYGVIFSRQFVEKQDGKGLEFYMDFQQALFRLLQGERLHVLFGEAFPNKRMSDELNGFFRAYQRVYH